VTIKNKYLLPLIQELIDKVKKAIYFTKLNIQWGYNNVRIREGDEWKVAFRTNRELFELLVIYFCLCNSPATFQLMIDLLFQDLISRGKVVIYMDNTLIFSKTLQEHLDIVMDMLKILKDNKLSVQTKKCLFHQRRIDYLEVIISKDSVEVDLAKIREVTNWPKPSNKQDIQ